MSPRTASPPYLARNRRFWGRTAAAYERRNAAALRRAGGRAWGLFRVPERELRLLDPVRGKDVLELGCGAAWWSIALARDGARVVGLDFSADRLAQARRRMARARVRFPLVEARAEAVPYPDARFDLVLSDYGATTFADPRRTVPEVARLLRPGGLFVFAHAGPLRTLCQDRRTDRLLRRLGRDYFGLHAISDSETTEFQLGYADWFRLFSDSGFVVERLVEPAAPARPQTPYLSRADQSWARRWPVETIWRVRKAPAARRRGR
jgi:ubiquinone/menaquinone biosynthesis C-methylase UbiE